jgi:hypothetical protein
MPTNQFTFERVKVAIATWVLAVLTGCIGHIGDPGGRENGAAGANSGSNVGGTGAGSTGASRAGSGNTGSGITGAGSTGSGSTGAGSTGAAGASGSSTGTGTGGPSTPATTTFACDPAARPPETTLRRLTTTQYRNTLASLAAWSLSDASMGAAVMGSIAEALRALPDDRREPVPQDLHGSYRRLDQTLQQEHVEGFYAAGIAMGSALSARLGALVGSCATDADASNDTTCLDQFIQRFGARALRRPLEASEIAFYRSVYGTSPAPDPQAYADVVGVMLNSPPFLYFVEQGTSEVSGQPGVYELSPFELASRLSYQFWDTMPDDALWKAASDGSLSQPDVYAREVNRLYDDARTRPTISRFVADWLKVDDLPALDARNQDPLFRGFAGADLPLPELRQQMVDDVLALVDFFIWNRMGSMDDLLTTELSFNKGPNLAKIYGVAPWDGVSTPPSFASGQRPGLLTRALFLTSGSANTRPIMKGVFIRRNVLCDDIPPPPPGADAMAPQLSPDMTTRQVVEELTEKSGTVCAGCHLGAINPLGFATEGFDALGRYRTEQRLFDVSGAEIGTRPVDTRSVPGVATGDVAPSSGPSDLARLIAKSGKANACLARNYFRFTYGRWENLALDGCTLEGLRKRLDGGGHLGDLLKEAVLLPAFRRRAFQ